MVYLTFLAAFLLSGIAGYYSIVGLTTIFVGAFWPIVAMGVALELAKLVTASWLYQNWKTAALLLRVYLTAAVVVLMLITSMGIFGFLAKSHIDSTQDKRTNVTELSTLNAQEKITQDRLAYLLARAKDPSTASGYLDGQIQNTQKELTKLNKAKALLLKEENKQAVELGPLIYIAEMFYDQPGESLDKAVRLVIMVIMFVFDPLAILLVIAGNILLRQKYPERFIAKAIPVIQKKDEVEAPKEESVPKVVVKPEIKVTPNPQPAEPSTITANIPKQVEVPPQTVAPAPIYNSPEKLKEQISTLLMTQNDVASAFKFFYNREPTTKDNLKPYIGMTSKQLLDAFFTSNEFLSREGANTLVNNATEKLQGIKKN